jgi:hypothetical protein
MEKLKNLQHYLTEKFPGCLIMPTKEGGKQPLWCHKNNQYKLIDVFSKGIPNCNYGCLILLSKNLIVIDIDDKKLSKKFQEDFPEFKDTVITKTKKGYHFYFERTQKCQDYKIYDGARKLFDQDTFESLPIDIKTICATGTSGVIAIPPSPNKVWIRALGDYDPLPISDEFIEYYLKHLKRNQEKVTKLLKNNITCSPNLQIPQEKVTKLPKTNIVLPTNLQIPQVFQPEFIIDLIKCLNTSRINNYTDWMNLGWCLHNISDTLLPIWIELSKQSSKFKSGECDQLWSNMRYTGYNIASLCKWAKDDNYDLYKQIRLVHKFNKDSPRLFYALLNSSIKDTLSAFNDILKHILINVLKITQEFNHTIVNTTDKYIILKYDFGFKNLEDSIYFKRIVRYFCTFETSTLKKQIKYVKNMFDDTIYYKVPIIQENIFTINTNLQSICDRYVLKTIKTNLELDVRKEIIKNNHHRDILEVLSKSDQYNIIFTDDYIKYLLSCIPNQESIIAWKIIGNIIFNLNLDKSYWLEWDSNRQELSNSHWDSFKDIPGYNQNLLLFIAQIYIKDCKRAFEHMKMIKEFYIIQDESTIFIGHSENYNKGVFNAIDGRCKKFDLDNYDLYAVIAPLGSGKSYRCIESMKTMVKENKTILVPTSRQTYADNITQRYTEELKVDFLCYKDIKNILELQDHHRLVIQLESIFKTNKIKYDNLILDEAESLLAQFSSKTMEGRFEICLKNLLYYACRADKIIICDGFYSNRLRNFLKFIQMNHVKKNLKIKYCVNEAKTISRKAYKIGVTAGRSKERLMNNFIYKMFEKIEQKKKFVIVSGSKTDLEYIIKVITTKYPNLKIKTYTSETDDITCRDELRNCETFWLDYDIIGWTSKVLIGVNFSIYNIFDCIFALGDNTSCVARDIHQSIMRIRYLISEEIYYLILEKDCPEKQDKLPKDINYFITQIITNISYANYDDMEKYIPFIKYLLAYNNFERYISKRCYTIEFERLLIEQNYKIIELDKDDKKNIDVIIQIKEDTTNYEKFTEFIKYNPEKIDDIQNRITKYKATAEDKEISNIYFFNVYFRNCLLEEEQLKFEHWNEMYEIYKITRYKQYMLNFKMELQDIPDIDNKKLFKVIHNNMLKIVKDVNTFLGFKHSLDFDVIITENKMLELYNKYTNNDPFYNLNSMKTLFSIRTDYEQIPNDRTKIKLMSGYLNYMYFTWIGIHFKSVDYTRITKNGIIYPIYKYGLIITENSQNIYDQLIKSKIYTDYWNNYFLLINKVNNIKFNGCAIIDELDINSNI